MRPERMDLAPGRWDWLLVLVERGGAVTIRRANAVRTPAEAAKALWPAAPAGAAVTVLDRAGRVAQRLVASTNRPGGWTWAKDRMTAGDPPRQFGAQD